MAEEDVEDERDEELSSISAIFPELSLDPKRRFSANLSIPVKLGTPLAVRFHNDSEPSVTQPLPTEEQGLTSQNGDQDGRIYHLTFLPPLDLTVVLPDGYPETKPPVSALTAKDDWMPEAHLKRLAGHVEPLWEDYGRCQIIYSYIDYLQQEAENGFGIADQTDEPLLLSRDLKATLLDFDRQAKKLEFEQETYDCGICLEPKKGSVCHRMLACGHVFCAACLQDVYNNAIQEGDIAAIRCLDPDCGSRKDGPARRVKKSTKTLGPGELLQIPLERDVVERYVNMKRKKRLEADKTTIYCPRQWCQGPARSKRYPKSSDLSQLDSYASDGEDDTPAGQQGQQTKTDKQLSEGRLAICEDCDYAFCRTCLAGWHGEFVRCWPRTTTELSEEERQSYDWIRMHTSPCPTCSAPSQKTHGCNHMQCRQCRTHFCYLCSAWLDPENPYLHFNRQDFGCYQRLWELEEGDPGDGNVHFEGPRGWEAAFQAVAEADGHGAQPPAVAAGNAAGANGDDIGGEAQGEQIDEVLARMNVGDAPPANAAALVEGGRVGVNPGPAPRRRLPGQAIMRREGPNQGLQRFIQMAVAHNEDEWDSDELDDDGDDADWEIPER